MYYTVNTAFMHYFDSLTDNLETHISEIGQHKNRFFQFHLQTFEFDSKIDESAKDCKGPCLPI